MSCAARYRKEQAAACAPQRSESRTRARGETRL